MTAERPAGRSVTTLRLVALVLAALLAVAAGAFLVVSLIDHSDAQDALDRANARLAGTRARAASAEERFAAARTAADDIVRRLEGLGPQLDAVVEANDRDLDYLRAELQAGIAGSVAQYNAAVEGRNGVIVEKRSALEQLRAEADDVLAALSLFTG